MNQAAGARPLQAPLLRPGSATGGQKNAPLTVAVSRSVKGAEGKPADHTDCLVPQTILHGGALAALRQIKLFDAPGLGRHRHLQEDGQEGRKRSSDRRGRPSRGWWPTRPPNKDKRDRSPDFLRSSANAGDTDIIANRYWEAGSEKFTVVAVPAPDDWPAASESLRPRRQERNPSAKS